MLPFIAFGIVILAAAWLAARLSSLASKRVFSQRIASSLLTDVLARTVGFFVLLLGVYIVLRVAGLTRLALTVLGGTGILGLVIGIAFRNITENFLASILLSVRRPYLVGDLVEIVGVLGYVQRLTTRSSVLMNLSGNYVEIPNATVYQSTIRNFTTNKNRREDFTVGIGYDVPIADAQAVALSVLRAHPAVLDEPEPWALVDSLSSAAVVLRIYFWVDGSRHSWLKVRSSAIRQLKSAFQQAGITMPDEAREVIFPKGVPVLMQEGDGRVDGKTARRTDGDVRPKQTATEPATTAAEGGLGSEAGEIEEQARRARPMEGENLLRRQQG
jgi:small-conductance mechanosensitive channel